MDIDIRIDSESGEAAIEIKKNTANLPKFSQQRSRTTDTIFIGQTPKVSTNIVKSVENKSFSQYKMLYN